MAGERKEKKKREKIMPSLMATTSAQRQLDQFIINSDNARRHGVPTSADNIRYT